MCLPTNFHVCYFWVCFLRKLFHSLYCIFVFLCILVFVIACSVYNTVSFTLFDKRFLKLCWGLLWGATDILKSSLIFTQSFLPVLTCSSERQQPLVASWWSHELGLNSLAAGSTAPPSPQQAHGLCCLLLSAPVGSLAQAHQHSAKVLQDLSVDVQGWLST